LLDRNSTGDKEKATELMKDCEEYKKWSWNITLPKTKEHNMKTKRIIGIVLRVIVYTPFIYLLLTLFFPRYFCCGGSHTLSKSEYKEMTELTKQGDKIAMGSLCI
jgi:hypothetical protein